MLDQETQRLVERMGLKFEGDGMPRIAGRILGYLLVCHRPRSLDELAEDLQVSKASASGNARLLERLGALERLTLPGDRRDYYRVVDDLHLRMLELRVRQLRETRDLLESALCISRAEEPGVRARLETFASFFTHMLDEVTAAGARWCEEAEEAQLARSVAGSGD